MPATPGRARRAVSHRGEEKHEPLVNEAPRDSDWRDRRLDLNSVLRRTAVVIGFIAVLIFCWRAAEIRPSALFEAGALCSPSSLFPRRFPSRPSSRLLRV